MRGGKVYCVDAIRKSFMREIRFMLDAAFVKNGFIH